MPTLRGFTAHICVGGEPVHEYGLEVDAVARKAVAYIEAKEGKEFSVRVTNSCGICSTVRFSFDGEQGAYQLVNSQPMPSIIEGKRVGPESMRPFAWGRIQLAEEDDPLTCHDETIIKDLGILRLDCRRARELGPSSSGPHSYVDSPAQKVFNEKSKKAQLSHTTGLAAIKRCPPAGHGIQIAPIDSAPYVLFEWKYLSRDLLEVKGLIEPAPVVMPATKKRGVKVEASGGSPPKGKKVKMEKAASAGSGQGKPIVVDEKSPVKKKPIILDID